MNKFIPILIAILAAICYVECGSKTSTLVKELDDHVQFKTEKEGPLEVLAEGLRFINPRVENPEKYQKKSVLGLFKSAEENPSATDIRYHLNEMKNVVERGNQIGCSIGRIKLFLDINTNLYEIVGKDGKLHSVIKKYLEIVYAACAIEFKLTLDMGSPEDVDSFMKVVLEKAPQLCGDVPKGSELRAFECAARLSSLNSKETAKIVLDVIKEKNDIAQLSKDTDTADLKRDVRRRIGDYINSAIIAKCHSYYERRFSYRGDDEIVGINKTISYWIRFAKIAGVEQDDDIIKARGRAAVCYNIGNDKIFDAVTEAAYGQIPAPKK